MIPPREPQEEQTILDRWNYSGLPSVAAFNHAVDVANAHYRENAALRGELARLQQELRLAIAHDRQPYPTAWAYEQACKALETQRQRAVAAESALSAQQAQIQRIVDRLRGLQTYEYVGGGARHVLCERLNPIIDDLSALLIQETPSEQG